MVEIEQERGTNAMPADEVGRRRTMPRLPIHHSVPEGVIEDFYGFVDWKARRAVQSNRKANIRPDLD